MSVEARIGMKLDVTETLTGGPISSARIRSNAYSTEKRLSSSTTPAVSKHAAGDITLASGTLTLDLTSLAGMGPNGATVNGTGLKVIALKLLNPSTNTHVLTLAPGGSNAYNLLGASFLLKIKPGDEIQLALLGGAAPAIGSGAKTLTLTDDGAGGTETHQIQIVMG